MFLQTGPDDIQQFLTASLTLFLEKKFEVMSKFKLEFFFTDKDDKQINAIETVCQI